VPHDVLSDDAAKPDAFARTENRVKTSDALKVIMRIGGGYVARFMPRE